MQTCQNHTGKAKEHTGTEQHYRYMQSYSKHTAHTYFHFFLHYQDSRPVKPNAGELQILIRLAALNVYYKLLLSILTLIRANEQHSHVLSKEPQTGGNIDSSRSFAVFHKRTDAIQAQLMTANFTRHVP